MKGEKAAQLELLLHAHPEGMRKAEIARRIGVHRSTVSRYVDELKKYTKLNEENNLIRIAVPKAETEPLSLSIYESLAFDLSARMLTQNCDIQNPHLVTGLRKIAMNMNTYAPSVSQNIMKLAEEIDRKLVKQNDSEKYNDIMEALIDGWISGKIVKVIHNEGGEDEETEFAPYFIGFMESDDGRNPISVTGRLRHTTDIATLEISSIISAEILNETYTIPDNLKAFKKKAEAEELSYPDMIPLTLKITEKSALNSFGTLFHTKPYLETQEDGTYICTMNIENSFELCLRILQCGTSAKIIGPDSYKKKFLSFVDKVRSQYNPAN